MKKNKKNTNYHDISFMGKKTYRKLCESIVEGGKMYRFEKDKDLVGKFLDIIRDNGFSVKVNKNDLTVDDCAVEGRCGNCLFNDTAKIGGDCSLGWLQYLLEEVDEGTPDKCKNCVHLEDKGEYYMKCDWCQHCCWSKSKTIHYMPKNPSELKSSMCRDCKYVYKRDDEHCSNCLVVCVDNFKKKEMTWNEAIEVFVKQDDDNLPDDLKEAYTMAIKVLKKINENGTDK